MSLNSQLLYHNLINRVNIFTVYRFSVYLLALQYNLSFRPEKHNGGHTKYLSESEANIL